MKVPVVIDTNVLISGYLWKGTPRKVIKFARSENYELLYCTESMTEFVRILSGKFHMDAGEVLRIVSDIKGIGRNIAVVSHESPISEDPTDNLFINMAIDGAARIIISGDSHLLKLKRYKEFEIIKAAEFLNKLKGKKE